MAVLDSLRLALRRFSLALASVSVVAIAGMMLTITYDVLMRFAFAAPTDWAYPLNAMGVLGSTMLALPYLYVRRQHIAMDLLHRSMRPGMRRASDLVTAAATVVFGVVLAVMALRGLIVSVEGGMTGAGTFNIPNWVAHAALLVTGATLAIAAVVFPPTAPDDDGPTSAVPGEARTAADDAGPEGR
ncbi:TRAP transporter small permease [Saccharomonospora sp. CUA-673]|uniref:TRAP transporter small permease n=1 Tax=Saccharomonospora sp. CUA-673 TaxID=1904969 RepID=UPI00111542CB|nr:TRAP transporter small permease [Saccharomonospora sp. CUA-673]